MEEKLTTGASTHFKFLRLGIAVLVVMAAFVGGYWVATRPSFLLEAVSKPRLT